MMTTMIAIALVLAPSEPAAAVSPARVAILRDAALPREGAPSDPDRLRDVLARAGFEVLFLGAADLAHLDASATRPDLVVLPYGPVFPAPARDAFVAYLRAGGAFLSMGGYAFDHPVWPDGTGGWTPKPPDGAPPFRLNARHGRPGDTLGLAPDQIGVFDPAYTFERATRIRGDGFAIDTAVEGFAAVALIGSNSPVLPKVHATWRPLLSTADRYGLSRGPAGGIVHFHAGPYAGSSAAFFGVTNRDLFAPGVLPDAFIARVVEELIARVSIVRIDAPACARPGETPEIAVRIRNAGRRARPFRLTLETAPGSVASRAGSIAAGETKRIAFRPPLPAGDWFVRIRAALADPDDRFGPIEARTGMVIWDPEAEKDPPPELSLRFAGNTFEANGRPAFLTGANQTGVVWYSDAETPLVWLDDMRAMADLGLTFLRILHFSPFAAGGADSPRRNDPLRLADPPPDETIRKTDAIVRIARACGIAPFLTLHDWMPVELDDRGLAAQRTWARFWAKRYARIPSMVYDIQNEPSMRGGDEAARVEIARRWIRENRDGVREGDPRAPVTVGFIQFNEAMDQILAAREVDFANMHFYGPLEAFPPRFKWIDRRAYGKGFSLGEFGAMEAHDARVRGQTGDPWRASARRFLAMNHEALGLGAAFTACWDLKEMPETVFPWGIRHRDGTPKRVAEAYRAISLLFRTVEPVYEPPQLYLLVPDRTRIGADAKKHTEALYAAIGHLIGLHVPFAILNEFDLGAIPDGARAIIWPLARTVDAEVREKVAAFAEKGGHVLRTEEPPAADAREIYRRFLDEAGVARIAIDPDRPDIHVHRVPCRSGATAYVAINYAKEPQGIRIARPGLAISLGPLETGFALIGRDGSLLAIEGDRVEDADGREILRADAGAMAIALDGRDLRRSARILGIGLGAGRVHLAAGAGWGTPRIEVGIIEDGAWRILEEIPAAPDVQIDEDRAFRLILAADGDLPGARAAAIDLLRL
ncbi:MAG: hypothetical protein JXP34_00150 [Planctomycetes bacterium]|nr:hypothetical protein [Planctomycetota bacterium]